MEVNKFNKKLINNLVLGSSLFGVFASIITQVQGTQRTCTIRPKTVISKAREYNDATDQLRRGLSRRDLSMEECIRFVRDKEADPNIQALALAPKAISTSDTQQSKILPPSQQSESLTLLEEAILSRYPEALEIFIKHGADVCTVSNEIKKFGKEVTLLHLALLTPDEMKALDKIRSVGVQNHAPADLIQASREQQSKKFKNKMGLGLTEEAIPPQGPYIPQKVLELLMKELSAKRKLSSTLNAKDENGKTVLDWAIERFLALALNPELLKVDLQTPIADLKIPILNLQIKEPDQQMKKEYENVIEWLLLDLRKTYDFEPTCNKENGESYGLIIQLKEKGEEVFLTKILNRQKARRFQSFQLGYLQTLLRQKEGNVQKLLEIFTHN
jgi:hypothetical protein